ncbi:MAG: hypothetical protein AAGF30_10660 [Pseudomonadota bacterium]
MFALVACTEATPPGQAAAAIGVPPGDALFSSGRDARAFDTFADRFATIDCRGLAASRAALRAEAEDAPRATTGLVAGAVGVMIGGPAGALTNFIGREASQLVSQSGNLRLAAVEAVAVAKECDAPPTPQAPPPDPPAPAADDSTGSGTNLASPPTIEV